MVCYIPEPTMYGAYWLYTLFVLLCEKNWLKRTLNENKETMYICSMWHQSKYCSTLWNNRKLPCPKKRENKCKKKRKEKETVEWMEDTKSTQNMTKIWVNSGFLSEESTVLYVKKCACVLDGDDGHWWTSGTKSRNVWNDQMPRKHYRTIHPGLVVFQSRYKKPSGEP